MYTSFPVWTRVYAGFFGLNRIYMQLCIDTVAYTLIFQDFVKSFCFRRCVCWSEYFLSSQFLLSIFGFAASFRFRILSCCGKFWSCFCFVASVIVCVWTHKISFWEYWMFWSSRAEILVLIFVTNFIFVILLLCVKTAFCGHLLFLLFWKLLSDDFESCLSWSFDHCHQALFATFWLLRASWNTYFVEFSPILSW